MHPDYYTRVKWQAPVLSDSRQRDDTVDSVSRLRSNYALERQSRDAEVDKEKTKKFDGGRRRI